MDKHIEKGDGPDAPHDQPANTYKRNSLNSKGSDIGTFPTRHNTVTAEVISRLLNGETLTGMDAVVDANTTRLAAYIHYIEGEYGWSADHVDMDVGTNDGRVTVIRAYFLPRHIIRKAFEAGALEFCRNVKTVRAATRKLAAEAKKKARQRHAVRSVLRRDPLQGSLFGEAT